MKYRKKSEIIEAVKWDGKIETINNNKWLEDAIKEDRVVLAMNDADDKEPILLINSDGSGTYTKIEKDKYIIKEVYSQSYRIITMSSVIFEERFEVVKDKNNNCVVVDLELNTEEFNKKLNEAKEELKKVLNDNKWIENESSFKFVTKDMYITLKQRSLGCSDLNTLNAEWDRISKGHNFVLRKDDPISYRYYSVEEIDRLFERDNLEKGKVTIYKEGKIVKATDGINGRIDSCRS